MGKLYTEYTLVFLLMQKEMERNVETVKTYRQRITYPSHRHYVIPDFFKES